MRKMSAVETWTRKGKREGKLEGKQEGKQEGIRLAMDLLSLLQQRFGPLPQHVPAKLGAMPSEEVESLFKRAASATSLAELNLDG